MLDGLKNLFSRKDPLWERYKEEAAQKAFFTPDMADLQNMHTVNIFLYNEVQSGQPHFDKLGKDPTYRGCGYTESSDFVMIKKMLGLETFPFALEITEDQKMGMTSLIGDPGQVMGEIYTVSPAVVVALDNYLLNTVQFERKRTTVLLPFKTDKNEPTFQIQKMEVFMWMGNQEFWTPQLKDSEQRKLFQHSQRLFNVKENNNEEPLSAYYVFDFKLEVNQE